MAPEKTEPSPLPHPAGKGRPRLESLDIFRGLTMGAMILVNNPGSWSHVYPPLRHAEWHGCTPTDLIFPFFLFIVGVAMAYSLRGALEARARGEPIPDTGRFWVGVARRGLVLIGLGLFMAWFMKWEFATLRYPGVLQRIGLCYAAAVPIVVFMGVRAQAAIAGAVLIGYWLAMALLGDLTREGNLAAVIDRAVIGPAHLYKPGYDPEGLLSTLPAIVTTLAGYWCGTWIRRAGPTARAAAGMAGAGFACVAVGWLWGLALPLNKPLWTGSYVVYTAGWAMILLSGIYWLVDVRRSRAAAAVLKPMRVMGVNAIVLFVGSGLLARVLVFTRIETSAGETSVQQWIYRELFASWAGPMNGSLAYAAATVAAWWVVLYAMWRRGVVVKV